MARFKSRTLIYDPFLETFRNFMSMKNKRSFYANHLPQLKVLPKRGASRKRKLRQKSKKAADAKLKKPKRMNQSLKKLFKTLKLDHLWRAIL